MGDGHRDTARSPMSCDGRAPSTSSSSTARRSGARRSSSFGATARSSSATSPWGRSRATAGGTPPPIRTSSSSGDDWGEWYADVSRLGFRDLIANRVAPGMLQQGAHRPLPRQHRHGRDARRAAAPGCSALVAPPGAPRPLPQPAPLHPERADRRSARRLRYYDGWNREDVHVFIRFRYGPLRSGRHGRTDAPRWPPCAGFGSAASSSRRSTTCPRDAPEPPQKRGVMRVGAGALALREQHRADPRSAGRRLLSEIRPKPRREATSWTWQVAAEPRLACLRDVKEDFYYGDG